jgi:HicB family
MRLILSTAKQDFEPGETLLAYHPRLHPQPSPATVVRPFRATPTAKYIRLRWADTDLEQSTHWQNACKPADYQEPEPTSAGMRSMPQVDIHLRMPPALHERLAAIGEAQSTSLNQTIVLLLTSATAGFQFNDPPQPAGGHR